MTEKGPETTSRLMIQKAVPSDSGIYTCQPSNANPSSIKVHVVNGKCRGLFKSRSPLSLETSRECSVTAALIDLSLNISSAFVSKDQRAREPALEPARQEAKSICSPRAYKFAESRRRADLTREIDTVYQFQWRSNIHESNGELSCG